MRDEGKVKLALLTIELFLPQSRSLKDKRRVIKSLKDRLRSRFNLSIAEVEHLETWQRCRLAAALVSSNGARLEADITEIVNTINNCPDAMMTSFNQIFYL